MTAAVVDQVNGRDVETEEHVLRMLVQADPENLDLRAKWQAAQKAVRDRSFRPRYLEACSEPEFIRAARERGVDPIRAARGRVGGAKAAENGEKADRRRQKAMKKRAQKPASASAAPTPTPPSPPAVSPSKPFDPKDALLVALDALMETTEERRAELRQIMQRLEHLPEEVDQLEIASNRVAHLLGEPPPFTRWRTFKADTKSDGSQN